MTTLEWRRLIEFFVSGEIDGPAFERRFLDTFRAEVDLGRSPPYAVDLMFYEVDAYCADPALRGEHDIDEAALRAAGRRLVERLDEPWPALAPETADDRRDARLKDNFRRAAALGLLRN